MRSREMTDDIKLLKDKEKTKFDFEPQVDQSALKADKPEQNENKRKISLKIAKEKIYWLLPVMSFLALTAQAINPMQSWMVLIWALAMTIIWAIGLSIRISKSGNLKMYRLLPFAIGWITSAQWFTAPMKWWEVVVPVSIMMAIWTANTFKHK